MSLAFYVRVSAEEREAIDHLFYADETVSAPEPTFAGPSAQGEKAE